MLTRDQSWKRYALLSTPRKTVSEIHSSLHLERLYLTTSSITTHLIIPSHARARTHAHVKGT